MILPATTAALLTPQGRGAIATIGVRGPRAVEAVARCFSPARSVSGPANAIRFGRWQRDPSHAGEELVICRTSADAVEVHCHGGHAAVEAILRDLSAEGVQIVNWQSWIEAVALDDFSRQACIALASATTQRTAAILLDQYRGALAAEWRAIEQHSAAGQTEEARQRIDRLLARAAVGLHLTEPFRVVLAGAPNVGKSSLINALLGYQRSIVYDQPGTTRDVLSATTALDGWPVQLSDTAGIRDTSDPLEGAGIERAQRQLAAADLVVLVSDKDEPPSIDVPTGARCLRVRNKRDLVPESRQQDSSCLWLSARTGQGIDELQKQIVRQLVPLTLSPGDAVPFLPQHIDALEALRCRL